MDTATIRKQTVTRSTIGKAQWVLLQPGQYTAFTMLWSSGFTEYRPSDLCPNPPFGYWGSIYGVHLRVPGDDQPLTLVIHWPEQAGLTPCEMRVKITAIGVLG